MGEISMKVQRKVLLEILNKIRPGVATKDQIEGGTHFIFEGDRIFTFNDQISISSPSPINLNCSVPSQELHTLLNKLTDEEIDLELKDGNLKITAQKTKASLFVLNETESLKLIRSLDLETLNLWFTLPKDFLDGISLCMFSVSKDTTLGWMSCVCVSEDMIFSTDDVRITKFKMCEKIENAFFLPLSSIKHLINFIPIKYCLRDGWVHFCGENNTIFSIRMLDLAQPEENIENFFSIEGVKLFLPENEEFKRAIDRAGIIEDKELEFDRKVYIEIKGENVIIKSQKEGVGWIEEKIVLSSYDENLDISFRINPSFLKVVMEIMPSLTMVVGENKCLLTSANFQHILALPI